jgi:hypothetical protein
MVPQSTRERIAAPPTLKNGHLELPHRKHDNPPP